MRLFSSGAFYLHSSSSLSAEWLCDRDTIAQHRHTGNLLSTIMQMHTMEADKRLYPVDINIYNQCNDVCDWLHASAYNVAWMIDYFNVLDHKCARLFNTKHLSWEFKHALVTYLPAFDSIDTTQDWLPLTPHEARASYKVTVKLYQYRRCKKPFWITLTKHTPIPEVATDDASELPSIDALLAELQALDLDTKL